MVNNLQIQSKLDNDDHFRDQLAELKESLLNPAEVKFQIQEDYDDEKSTLRRSSSDCSDIESISSSVLSRNKRTIPDGGYGWVIVFSSLMVSLIADGISFSFGLIYTELLNYFQEGPTKTAWIGSLFLAVPLMSGPVMSNLVDKYGCRKMTMLGGLVGCLGFTLSAFSNSVEMLYLTFGIIAGLGLGVIYVTAVVSIAFWFETKRTFAIGIGASGTGIGTFLYAPFTQWLISYYGWRGATLILGGTLFNFSVFGALMIDPDWLIEENKIESRSQSIQTFSNSSVALDEIKKMIVTGAPKEDLLDTLVTNLNTEANQQIVDPEIVNAKKFTSEILLPTFISNRGVESEGYRGRKYGSKRSLGPYYEEAEYEDIRDAMIEENRLKIEENLLKNPEKVVGFASKPVILISEASSVQNASDVNPTIPQDPSDDDITPRSGVHGSRYSLNENILIKPSMLESVKEPPRRRNTLDITQQIEIPVIAPPSPLILTIKNDNPYKKSTTIPKTPAKTRIVTRRPTHFNPVGNLKNFQSLKYSNYLRNMKIHRNLMHHRGALLSTHRYRLKASSCPNIYRNSMTTIAKEEQDVWYDDFIDIIKSIFDFSLFLEYKFGMMSLSTLFLYVWYIIPYFYITEFLLVHDFSEEQSAYLISIIGIGNTVGMIGLGWVGDQPWCKVTKTYGLCMFLCGISMFLIPLATWSYAFLMILCVLFGVTFGSSFSFTPMITSRLVDMDDFTLAYGLILLVQGIGSLIGPPLAGFIYDMTSRWDDSFYIGGVFVMLSGLLGCIIGPLSVESIDDEENIKN
ncbi:monocarboxylate transporter 14-like [Chironomus tepperi]|uniref:monocarboxylate transporter 14-like n=1 Tax=Chironomus tepperi TaxID=113505 RepID=UPI00391F96E6